MTTSATMTRDDASLAIHDVGQGQPVVFQHGLGGDEAQVAQTFPDAAGLRRLTVECRGHGASSLGSREPFSIGMFADDVLAAADERKLDRLVVGGISMGSAIALRLAHLHPDRVAGLILVRPAWTFTAAPENMAPIRLIADLLRSYPLDDARAEFSASQIAREMAADAPDNLASLLGYFDRPDARGFASVLAGVATDGPGVSQDAASAITVPTLVVGNRRDFIHPLEKAEALAAAIPGSTFVVVTPKADDKAKHFIETRTAITQFLSRHFPGSTASP